MADASKVLKQIKDDDVKFVDLRFSDPRGKLQHLTMDVSAMDEAAFADGVMFDGSSIAGWKDISQSDMALMPDPDTATLDPFFAQTTLAVFCDIVEPTTGELYERDPRGTARKAEAYLQQTGIGDTAYFGPEAEFFIFDDVRFASDPVQLRIQARLDRTADQHGYGIRDGESRSPAAHQGRILPRSTDRFLPGYPFGNAVGDVRDGCDRRKASP